MSNTAALVEGHWLHAWGNERKAECECGEKFSWENREDEHAAHILSEAWKQDVERGRRYPRAPVGRWWYPARLNEEGQVEVYYPKKNPVWQVQKEAQENLNKRTRRRQSEPGTEAEGK